MNAVEMRLLGTIGYLLLTAESRMRERVKDNMLCSTVRDTVCALQRYFATAKQVNKIWILVK